MKSPYVYFGGKSKIAGMVWERFGDVDNYIEPFAGSIAVLLKRPLEHLKKKRMETVNDVNHYIVNFWRAVKSDPEQVAYHADNPIMEADLHARHEWLVKSEFAEGWRERIVKEPEYFDAKVAGWWVWGINCWIGGGWCQDYSSIKRPQLGYDRGTNSVRLSKKIPQLTRKQGINVSKLRKSLPRLGYDCGTNVVDNLVEWMVELSDRMANVKTCYGHWSRVCGSPSTTVLLDKGNGVGVFLDPPYLIKNEGGKRHGGLYFGDNEETTTNLQREILDWCSKWGNVPGMKIAVCGYERDGYEELGWEEIPWETQGGYSNQFGESANKHRERIWFNPGASKPVAKNSLF